MPNSVKQGRYYSRQISQPRPDETTSFRVFSRVIVWAGRSTRLTTRVAQGSVRLSTVSMCGLIKYKSRMLSRAPDADRDILASALSCSYREGKTKFDDMWEKAHLKLGGFRQLDRFMFNIQLTSHHELQVRLACDRRTPTQIKLIRAEIKLDL